MSALRRPGQRRFVYGWADIAAILACSEQSAQRRAGRGEIDPHDIHSIIAHKTAGIMEQPTRIDGGTCCSGDQPPPLTWRADVGAYQCSACFRMFGIIDENLDRVIRRTIRLAMENSGRVCVRAAARLGIDRHQLRTRLRRHEMYGYTRRIKGE